MDNYKKSYLIILFPLFISGCGNYSSNEDTVDGKIKPIVKSISPSEGETNVDVTTPILLSFSKEIKTNTVTTDNSSANCTGTLQVSSDSFSTCVQMSSSPTVSNSSQAFTVTPSSNLSVLTTYKIRVTTGVKDSNDNTLSSQYETSNGFTTGTPPTVSSTSPADSDTSVSLNRIIAVTFSEVMDSASVTTNTSGTTCSGTLQVSSDSFSTCVQMSSSPTVSNSYQTFTVTPSSDLSVLTTYKIRVTTGVTDSTRNTLSSQYETSNGFTTGTTVDTTAPTVSSTSPADSDTSVSLNRIIAVTFSEAMDSASVTTNTSGTTCSGTLQVSSDSFSTCVQMSSSPTVSNSYQTFTVTPSSDLSVLTTYKIRVTTGVTDSTRNTLSSQYETSNGFTTGNTTDTNSPSNPTISINSGAATTTSTSVTLTISATDDVGITAFYASEASSTPSSSDSGWNSFTSSTSYSATVSFTLSSASSAGNYSRTVYVWFKDAAGNVSTSASDGITLVIKIPPTSTSIAIQNKSNNVYSSCCVVLQLSAEDDVGVTAFYISGSNSTPNIDSNIPISLEPYTVPKINLNTWYSVKNVTTNLSQKVYTQQWSQVSGFNLGTFNNYAWFRDADGSVSQVSTDSITCSLSNCY